MRQLATRALQDPGGASVRPLPAQGDMPQRQHARGFDRPVRLDGQGEDTGRLLAACAAVEADPSLIRAGLLEAPVAGGADSPPRATRLRHDPLSASASGALDRALS